MKSRQKEALTYAAGIILALAVGGLSAVLNAGKMNVSPLCAQPPLTPPAWLFPIVWTVLFALMGISSARIRLSGCAERSDALFLYGVQLTVNLLWTVFFFSFGALMISFFWLIFLILLVILMIVRFRRCDIPAARLQLPYLIWLCFAAYLNLFLWILN